MARLNAQGQLLLGRSGGPASIEGRVIVSPGGGPACWLDPHTILVNSDTPIGNPPTVAWRVLAVDTESLIPVLFHAAGANDLAAGGRRWIGWSPVGFFGSLGAVPNAGVRGAGLDGTLAYCPDRQLGVGMILAAPNGDQVEIPGAQVYDEYSLQVLGPGQAVWYDGQGVHTCGALPALRFAVAPGKCRLVRLPGEDWLVYWSESLQALVAQVNGATDGYLLQQGPFAFNHDAGAVNGEVVVGWSVTQGENPEDWRKVTLDRSQPRVPLTTQPVPPEPHPEPEPEPEPPHPEPPHPEPPIPPIPPHPIPPSPFAQHKELSLMDTKIVALRGPGGKFGRPDGPNTGPWGHLNQGWRGMVWDGDSPSGDNYKFELSRPDTKHKLVNLATRGLFGADPTVGHLA